MLTAIEIEAELGWGVPQEAPTPKASRSAGQDACQTTSLRVMADSFVFQIDWITVAAVVIVLLTSVVAGLVFRRRDRN